MSYVSGWLRGEIKKRTFGKRASRAQRRDKKGKGNRLDQAFLKTQEAIARVKNLVNDTRRGVAPPAAGGRHIFTEKRLPRGPPRQIAEERGRKNIIGGSPHSSTGKSFAYASRSSKGSAHRPNEERLKKGKGERGWPGGKRRRRSW